MKKNLFLLGIMFFLLLLTGGQSRAAATEWEFDPIHSNFYFEIDHTYAKVRGFFEDFSGTFRFDPENSGKSVIVFKVEAGSVNTNDRKRDNHLRTGDFLDVRTYPEIIFTSRKVTRAGNNTFAVDGELTIKDVTRPVTLTLHYLGRQQNPLDPKQTIAGFESRLTIDRLDYHVGTGKFYEMGVVGRKVDILVTLEMVLKD